MSFSVIRTLEGSYYNAMPIYKWLTELSDKPKVTQLGSSGIKVYTKPKPVLLPVPFFIISTSWPCFEILHI